MDSKKGIRALMLSHLQKTILNLAKTQGQVNNADILTAVYGFQPVLYGKIKFSRKLIGMKRYLAATSAVSRSLTRLRERGLLRYAGYCNNALTAKGRQVAKQLPNRLVSRPVIRAGENTG
jgi:hypothetical protein